MNRSPVTQLIAERNLASDWCSKLAIVVCISSVVQMPSLKMKTKSIAGCQRDKNGLHICPTSMISKNSFSHSHISQQELDLETRIQNKQDGEYWVYLQVLPNLYWRDLRLFPEIWFNYQVQCLSCVYCSCSSLQQHKSPTWRWWS